MNADEREVVADNGAGLEYGDPGGGVEKRRGR